MNHDLSTHDSTLKTLVDAGVHRFLAPAGFDYRLNARVTLTLIRRDQYATVACDVLEALKAEANDDHPDQSHFPKLHAWVRDAQDRMLRMLHEDGHITLDEFSGSHVEPQCIEHNRVHVFCYAEPGEARWIEVDPVTGRVSAL